MQNKSLRRSFEAAFVAVAACVLFVGCKRSEPQAKPSQPQADQTQHAEEKRDVLRTIEGQTFIRTRGAETFKLSLVDVWLYDEEALQTYLDEKRKLARPLYEYLRPFVKQAEEECSRAGKVMSDAIGSRGDEFTKASDAYSRIRKTQDELTDAANYTMSAAYYFRGRPQPLQMTKTDADGKFSFKVSSSSYVLAAFSTRKVGKETEEYYWMVRVTADGDKNVILANDNLCTSDSSHSLIAALDGFFGNASVGGIEFVTAFVEKHKREQVAREAAQQEAARQAQIVKAAKAEEERKAQLAEAEKKEMERRDDPKAARARAVEHYPDLANPDSPLSEEFAARLTIYRIEKKEFFDTPDWPTRLAKECSEALAAKRKAK